MGRKLAANVVVLDEHGDPVLVKAGEDLPSEYADQVGDHCFEEQGADSKSASKTRQASSK